MKKFTSRFILVILISFLLINVQETFSQVLISGNSGSPDASAMLEIQSNSKGLLIPRLTTGERTGMLNVAEGLLVYDSDLQSFFIYGKTAKGIVDWYNISDAAGIWTRTDTCVYLSDPKYNVGIGTDFPTKKLVIKAENANDTLLEIQDQNGNPLMVITPTLTKFNLINGSKGVAGGFAVGRYTGAKAINDPLLVVTTDSTRVYTKAAVGMSGGFAVGRYTGAKGVTETSFYTNPYSTRVYTGGAAKGVAGGFAVGRYTGAKGGSGNYMYMVPDNYFIGDQSGDSLQTGNYTGKYNTFFGFQTGMKTTTGGKNVFIGYKSGLNNIGKVTTSNDSLGFRNVFLGYESGFNNINGSDNVLLGYKAGHSVTTAGNNISIGSEAGYNNSNNSDNIFIGRNAGFNHTGDVSTTPNNAINNIYIGLNAGYGDSINGNRGNDNIFLGKDAGKNNYSGIDNIFLGNQAGLHNHGNGPNQGNYNVFIGFQSGLANNNGYQNIFMGYQSGLKNTTGFGNVFLGLQAGEANTVGTNSVYIGNYAGNKATENSNVCVGKWSGSTEASGNHRAFFGTASGYASSGNNNTYIGNEAGFDSNAGKNNVYVGSSAGYEAEGSDNVYLGKFAYGSYNSGSKNVAIGSNSGSSSTGSGNVFIGFQAGASETNSDRLYIENNSDNTPLIYGEFDRGYLQINDTLNIAGQYDMPSVHGTAGQVLLTNGSDAAYWADQSSLNDADWTVSGTNMYSAVFGNVGIGTTTPVVRLDIRQGLGKSLMLVRSDVTVNTNDQLGGIGFDSQDGNVPGDIKQSSASIIAFAAESHSSSDKGGYLTFWTSPINQDDDTDGYERMRITAGGNVGIGTTSPNYKLQIDNTTSVRGIYSYSHPASGTAIGIYGNAAGGSANYGVYGTASGGTTNWAGYFNGNVRTGNTTVAGSIQINSGTVLKKVQAGTATIGSTSGGTYFKVIIVTFPSAFSSTPKIICTPRTATGYSYDDVFVVTTKQISTTQFKVNVLRVDQNSSWGQNLLLDWYAWEQ